MKANSHKNQKVTQIYLPFLVICIVTVILIVLLLRRFGRDSSGFMILANISAIYIIIPFIFVIGIAFLFLVVMNVIIHRSIIGLMQVFPQLNEATSRITRYISKTAHAGLKPFWYVEMVSAIFNFGEKREE